ncbi:MAG: hypothetical protein AAGF95_24245, partial [Chloroflexota bacterium]
NPTVFLSPIVVELNASGTLIVVHHKLREGPILPLIEVQRGHLLHDQNFFCFRGGQDLLEPLNELVGVGQSWLQVGHPVHLPVFGHFPSVQEHHRPNPPRACATGCPVPPASAASWL